MAAPELFIYYQVGSEHEAAARAAATTMQAALCVSHPGLSARLLRRPASADGRSTLMEVYVLPATLRGSDTEQASVAANIERAAVGALAPWLVGERHVEAFLPCA